MTTKCVVAVMISFCAFTDAFLSLLTLWLHKRYVDFVSTEVLCFVSFFNCKIYFAAGREKTNFNLGLCFTAFFAQSSVNSGSRMWW